MAADDQPAADQTSAVKEVVVTGSRIKRSATDTAAPIDYVNKQDILDRGFVDVGDALNLVTSNAASSPVAPGTGGPSGSGQTYPNLFNLGSGRTLTLINGQRTVNTSVPTDTTTGIGYGVSSGGAGSGVDTGVIPIGLLDHIEVVQGGGAAVYGSDAIAGVVNYVMKTNFQGVEFDGQGGTSYKGDHDQYSARITAGTNFDGGRGNIAVDLEWSKTDPLLETQRSYSGIGQYAPTAGIVYNNARFYEFNSTGVVYNLAVPVPICNPGGFPPGTGGSNCFTGGIHPLTFSPDGLTLVPYNPGTNSAGGAALTPPFASGGAGFPLENLNALSSGVERRTANILGHYDLLPNVRVSGSFLYSHEVGTDPIGSQGFFSDIISPAPNAALPFNKNNPYLTPTEIAQISAADPIFAAGGNALLSKAFTTILPSSAYIFPTDTYSAHLGVDGDFSQWGRKFNWSVGFTHGEVDSAEQGWDVYTSSVAPYLANGSPNPLFGTVGTQPFIDATQNVVKNGSGQIVCSAAVLAVAPNCAPINPFGSGAISSAAAAYLDAPIGYHYRNREDDFLATFGGDLVRLPGGEAKFSVGYEHRSESAAYANAAAVANGLVESNVMAPPTSGSYDTNEYSGELAIPLLGGAFTVPYVKSLGLTAQGRLVDNSLAGQNSVWGFGLNLQLAGGLTLRASRSQNFRAPTLYEINQPISATPGSVQDPCDPRLIGLGNSPTTRGANCLALFAANPTYGTGVGEAAPGSSAAVRLAAFTDQAVNYPTALITSKGNSNLQNEVSQTFTYGLAFQPTWIPGRLVVTADYISVNISNGITAFGPSDFANSCYDNAGAASSACSYFTRNSDGQIVTATSTTYNAASLLYKGEVINIDYRFPLAWVIRRPNSGNLEVQLESTHNETLTQDVDGAITQAVGTINEPRWVLRGDLRYAYGPFRFTYEAHYLPASLIQAGANASNQYIPVVSSNLTHSISGSYDFGKIRLRAGINNLTNQAPSAPTLSYGDYIGRTFFVGLTAKY